MEDIPVPKRRRLNPMGEDVYLAGDGTVSRDEDKIIRAQQIFKENYYSPSGRWARLKSEKYVQCT